MKHKTPLTKKHYSLEKSEKHPHLRSIALAVSLAFTGISPNPAQAQTFTVVNTDDSGLGSLRRQVNDANILAGNDIIVFDPNLAHSTITLSSGEIIFDNVTNTDSLTIKGPLDGKANGIIIQAAPNFRVFTVQGATSETLTLENMTIMGGNKSSGAGLHINGPSLTLNHMVITGNAGSSSASSRGAGIYFNSDTNFTMNKSVISNNHSANDGAGIFFRNFSQASKNITLNESLITGNTSADEGSALYFSGRTTNIIINNSTIANNNSASDNGSAIFNRTFGTNANDLNTLTLNQSTLSGNIGGEALEIGANTNAVLNQSTITNNTGDVTPMLYGLIAPVLLHGGVSAYQPVVNHLTINNSILTGNHFTYTSFAVDPLGSYAEVNINHSLFNSTFSRHFINTGNTTAAYSILPDLGPLQSNGGPTLTHRPNVGSPALNWGDNTLVTANTDQRGERFTRIQNTTVEAGSVERLPIINGGDNEIITRRDITRALLKPNQSALNLGYSTGLEYHDVQAISPKASWIEAFKLGNYTQGCATDRFCPDSIVTREEMAVMFLKMMFGANYNPNPNAVHFNDIGGQNGPYSDWINELFEQGFTTGCNIDMSRFCPKAPVTRKWFNALLDEL